MASGNNHSSSFTLTFSGSTISEGSVVYYYGTSSSAMTYTGNSVTIPANTAVTYYVKACNSLSASVCSNNVTYVAIAPSPFIALLTGQTGFTQYTGNVTDVYTDYGVGVTATKVYYVTSNDINNVIFGGYCWKIIRTTETGGTKLLYNGVPSSGECTATGTATMIGNSSSYSRFSGSNLYNSPAYVGYMYNATSGTLNDMLYADGVNSTPSELKTKTESWFASSGINSSKLEDAVYCNDRSLASNSPYSTLTETYTSSLGNIYFGAYNRTSTSTATLACAKQTDAFSTENPKATLGYKVGFMTSDEAYLITSTVYNNSSYYWLGSPYYFSGSRAVVRLVGSTNIYNNNVNYTYGVRPVVSVNSGVTVTGGNGSTNSPFTLS